jgi:hypothetical protein
MSFGALVHDNDLGWNSIAAQNRLNRLEEQLWAIARADHQRAWR